ncbi:MAG: hypothetical protein V4538_17415, partial [Bacteroidota bacterium]
MKTAVNIKSQFCLLLVLLLFAYQSFAKVVVSPSEILTSSTLVTGGKVACYADIMNAYAGTIGTYSPFWPGPGSNASAINNKINAVDILKSVANIKLRVKDLDKYPNLCFPDNFTYTVNIKYKKLSTTGTYDATEQSAQLTVSYSKTKGQQYKSLDIFKIDDAVFFSAYIESITTSNSLLSIKDFVELYAELEYDYLTKPTLFSNSETVNGGIVYVSSISNYLDNKLAYFTPKVSASYDTDNEHILIKAAVRSDDEISAISGNSYFTDYWTLQKGNFTNWIDSVEIQWNFSEDQYFEYASAQFKEKEITSTTVTYIPQYNQYAISVVVPYSAAATADYILSNIFEKGVLSIRARFLGRIAVRNSGGSITEVRMIQCPWSDFFGGAQVYNSGGTASLGQSLALKIATYSPKLNWIFNCTYAEDGKKKEVINYFDGTLKSRQVITTSNTDDFALVKETIYDYQGRPAIEVLPVPTTPNSLKYVPNFNQSVNGTSVAYSATDFDFNTSNCGTTTLGMATTSGAAKYYSSNNAWLTGAAINTKHQFIPSSGNSTDGFYPFVQTVYTPDNTGRVSMSTQPGVDFRLGSPQKETRYFYGRPEQEELDRLFGAEVGFASHYTKEMVRDANGQFSVSIKDLSGKVIVTALTGDNGAGTNALSSATQTQDIDVDLLEHSQTKIEDGYLLSSPILVGKSQTYKFQYALSPATYSKLCNGSEFYCLDCIYNLEISITDECGAEYLQGEVGTTDFKPITRKIGPSVINDVCNTSGTIFNTNSVKENFSQKIDGYITLTLPAGKYTVSRKITVDQDARETYLREIVPNKLCKTLAEFEAEEAAKINLEQCRPCEAYNIAKKQGGDIRQTYITNVYASRFGNASDPDNIRKNLIGEEYDVAKERCGVKVNPCVTYREIMLNDVYPDGLYGDMSSSTGGNYSVFKTNTDASLWYQGIAYFDDIDNGIIVGSGTTVTKLKDLSLADLKKYWKREYAEALVHLHPEYYQYEACNILAESKTYDMEFSSVSDYTEANNWKYMEDVGTGTSNNKDPLITSLNTQLSTIASNFQTQINTTAAGTLGITIPGLSGSVSLKQLAAYLTFCKSTNSSSTSSCISSALSNISTCDYRAKNLFWTTYKALYQAIKVKLYNDFAYTLRNTTTYPNLDVNNIRFSAPAPSIANVGIAKNKNLAKIDEQCKQACTNMADGWINKLGACSFSSDPTTRAAEITTLKNALIAVCQNGCDEKNPLGASTVKPSSTNTDKSFEDVFIRLGYEYKTDCNPGLIKFPKPYDANGNMTDLKNNPISVNLQSDLCATGLNPCILFGNCNQTTVSTVEGGTNCNLISTSNNTDIKNLISAFDTMTCESGNCFNCARFRELNQEYYNKSSAYQANNTLTAFINSKIGFNLAETDYFNFMAKCLGYTSIPDNDMEALQTEYNQAYLIYKATTTSYTFAVNSQYNNIWKLDNEVVKPTQYKYFIPKVNNTYLTVVSENNESIITAGIGDINYFLHKEIKIKNVIDTFLNTRINNISNYFISQGICYNIQFMVSQILNKSINDLVASDYIYSIDNNFYSNTNYHNYFTTANGGYLTRQQYEDQLCQCNLISTDNCKSACYNLRNNVSQYLGKDIGLLTTADYNSVYNNPGKYHLRESLCNCGLVDPGYCNTNPGGGEGTITHYCELFEADLNSTYPNKGYINVLANVSTENDASLITFYNLVQTKSYKTYFIQLEIVSDNSINAENIRLWLKDILCSCDINNKFCAEEQVKCQTTASVNNFCSLPNAKVLALQALLQEIVKGTTSSCYLSPPIGYTYTNNRLAGSNKCYPLSATNLLAIFSPGLSSSSNLSLAEIKYYPTLYSVGNIRELNAEITLKDGVAPGPSSSYFVDLKKRFKLSMVVDDSRIGFQNIVSISDLVPVYTFNNSTSFNSTNWFVFKASVLLSIGGKNYSKEVLVNGYFEDGLTRQVDCNVKCIKLCKKPDTSPDPCEVSLQNSAKASAWYNYNNYKKAIIEEERANYNKKCLDALKTNETFVKKYTDNQYHYTLYYYDVAGNLVRTVPPQGVNPLNPTNTKAIHTERKKEYANYYHVENPDPGYTPVTIATTVDVTHTFTTNYKYNTLDQLIWQTTPDAGISQFGYDKVGRLILSQNAKQYAKTPQSHSYTNYDALGRIVEVGELVNNTLDGVYASASTLESPGFVQSDIVGQSNKKEITRTYYDNDPDASGAVNLRSRVAKVAFFNTYPTSSSIKPSHAVSYTYDIQGNVKQIKRYIQSLEIVNQSTKTVDYDFDVISGKVENVYYQNGKVDQYIHHYKYDAENRLVSSYSAPRQELIDATNNAGFDNIGLDAAYQYYYHGPLARTELGELKVQGVDYAYTLQGWLKGVNSSSLKAIDDMGKDAYMAETTNVNKTVPKDEMGFILNYHDKDYTQIQQNSSALAYINKFNGDIISTNAGFGTFAKQLYNGNISSMVTAIGELMSGTAGNALVSAYQYDQLNRIAEAKYFYKDATNALVSTTNWNNQFTYDANGNIVTQFRNGAGTTVAMDNLTYNYYANTNRLKSVKDLTASGNYPDDIDNQENTTDLQNTINYSYDAIGNLVKDQAEEIDAIEWNIYGKIKKITRQSGSTKPNLEFEYTPDGHRAVKIVIPANTAAPRIYTYYMRDAQGNILATYEREFNKTVDFEQLTYSSVNSKLVTKSGNTSFAGFIAGQHQTVSTLKTALENNIIGNSTKLNSFLTNSDMQSILNANTSSANAVIDNYDNWVFLQAISNFTSKDPLVYLRNQMYVRNQANNSFQDLPTTIINNPITRRAFFLKFMDYYNDDYVNTMDELGIPLSDQESELESIQLRVDNDGPTSIVDALNNNFEYQFIENGYRVYDLINELLINEPTFRVALLNNIPEFKRLFYLGAAGSFTFSGDQLNLGIVVSALSSFDYTLLNTTTRQNFIGGENAMVAWFKNNMAYQFVYQSVFIDAAPVTTFQAANPTLYNSSGTGNGIKQYFNAIRTYYGQSITDQLLNEYLPTSNLYVDKLKVNEWHMYGSSRLGIYKANITVVSKAVHITGTVNEGNVNVTEYSTLDEEPVLDNIHIAQTRGAKNYELSNHLGNVLVVVSDKKKYNCGGQSLIEANFDAGSYNNIYPVSNVSGMSLSGNKLNVTCTATNAQVGSLFDVEGAAGKTYQVDFDVTKSSSTSQVWFQAAANYNTAGGGVTQYTGFATSNGHYTFTFTAPQGMYRYKFGADNSGSGSFTIDNLVVKSVEDGAYEAEVLNAQ